MSQAGPQAAECPPLTVLPAFDAGALDVVGCSRTPGELPEDSTETVTVTLEVANANPQAAAIDVDLTVNGSTVDSVTGATVSGEAAGEPLELTFTLADVGLGDITEATDLTVDYAITNAREASTAAPLLADGGRDRGTALTALAGVGGGVAAFLLS